MSATIATTRHGACASCTRGDNQIVWHDGPCPQSSAAEVPPSSAAVSSKVSA